MLGIIIGVGSVIAMVAIGQGSKQSIHDQLSNMGTNMITVQPASNLNGGVKIAGSSFQTLTIKDIVELKANEQYITEISPAVSSKGQAINGALNWPTTMSGVAPEYLDIRKLSLKDGIAFTQNDVITSAKVCLIGQTVIDNLFPNGENPIGKIIRFWQYTIPDHRNAGSKGLQCFRARSGRYSYRSVYYRTEADTGYHLLFKYIRVRSE